MKAKPQDAAHCEIVKLAVSDLRKGMFVAELDRPWSETPFLFEGFEIETDADLEAVRQHCHHVFIDLGRTQALRVELGNAPAASFIGTGQRGSMEREMAAAESAKTQASKLVKTFQDEIRFGNGLDMGLAKGAVSECVASVLRNPDAMLFLAQMEEKNLPNSEHAFNVCVYSIILGRRCGLRAGQLENLGFCGLLHDIGNIEIPGFILNKPGPLSEEEFAVVQQHTVYGRDILMAARNIYPGAVDAAYGHHECLDGSGYPRRLAEHQINFNTRVVAVVDKYAALTRNTVYRPAHNHLDAVALLNAMAQGNKIDKALCDSFIACLGFYPPGTIVELNSGEVAIVLKSNLNHRLSPQVLVVRDAEKNPAECLLDLAAQPVDGKGRVRKIKVVHLPGYLGIDLSQHRYALIQAYD